MADNAELTIEELQKLRQASALGDRDHLARMRGAPEQEIRRDVEGQAASEPGIWESIKNWWLSKGEDESGAGRQDVGDAVTRILPPALSATNAVRRQRAKTSMLDRLAD